MPGADPEDILFPEESQQLVCLVLDPPLWLMLLLFKYQEGIQYCKVPIQTQARAADFSRPLKAESTGAAWCCHPPALIDEVTEHGLHLLFRRLL